MTNKLVNLSRKYELVLFIYNFAYIYHEGSKKKNIIDKKKCNTEI